MLSGPEQKILDDVEDYGWSAMSVAPRVESDDAKEWFTYTIGLPKSYSWPEIVCFGIDGQTAHGILTDAIAECKERGARPHAAMLLHKTLGGQDALLADGSRIPDPYLGSAIWYARYAGLDGPPEKLQLLWPDENGRFPHDPACDPEVRQLQTPMGIV
ncbi:DUF4262 domain-containing protein [Sphingomonas sp. GCM10030256]|uniref:DUF4262 domain-containing protein n=1 Tax=Sphingomonas sp. GCM10030256 TaxID=3273427 RepID=UPI00361EDC70